MSNQSNPLVNHLAHHLSRRERQIMDAIYTLGQASAAQVREALPEPPSYSSVRKLLQILEDKGHLSHNQEGPHHGYPTTPPRRAAPRAHSHAAKLAQVWEAERPLSHIQEGQPYVYLPTHPRQSAARSAMKQ